MFLIRLLKDALFKNQSNYEQSSASAVSESCVSSVGCFELSTNQCYGSHDYTTLR